MRDQKIHDDVTSRKNGQERATGEPAGLMIRGF
jgi:hypothetical protein